ncbi:MAG: hypothetical protein FJY99_04025 [Candidatus Sericytochromatia bacterium]|nr:hypothetical protein [Candidatus Tanganyikabacteria bacterium]
MPSWSRALWFPAFIAGAGVIVAGCPQVPGTGEGLMPLAAVAITGATGSRVELAWGEVPTIPRYEVVRVEGSRIQVLGSGPGRTWTDRDGVVPGTTFIYVIRALDGANAERWRSTSPGLRPATESLPLPSGLMVSGSSASSGVLDLSRKGTLSWQAVPDAVVYRVAIADAAGTVLLEDLVAGTTWPATDSVAAPDHWPVYRPRGARANLPAGAGLVLTLTALAPAHGESLAVARALKTSEATRDLRLVD